MVYRCWNSDVMNNMLDDVACGGCVMLWFDTVVNWRGMMHWLSVVDWCGMMHWLSMVNWRGMMCDWGLVVADWRGCSKHFEVSFTLVVHWSCLVMH